MENLIFGLGVMVIGLLVVFLGLIILIVFIKVLSFIKLIERFDIPLHALIERIV